MQNVGLSLGKVKNDDDSKHSDFYNIIAKHFLLWMRSLLV